MPTDELPDMMPRKLLVTGYGGFVAGSVVRHAIAEWSVTAISRSKVSGGPANVDNPRFDLRQYDVLNKLFARLRPTAVVHTAAIANIDYCESHRDEAEDVNVNVTKRLAELCREHNSRLVFCSTDTVFDGKSGRYNEKHVPIPVNFYAETKVRAENAVSEILSNAIIARLALVMGLPLIGGGNSFLARMVADFDAGKPVQMAENEIRTPVDVVTLGRALVELAGNDFTGILHLAGNTRLNRFEMAQRVATRLGYSTELVKPIHSNALPGRAPRPDDASLDNSLARRQLTTPMLDFDDALDLVLATR
jgi:dTDP-4-dehydrorhamnose reductase